MLVNYKPTPRRLKSRKSFLYSVDPLDGNITTWREVALERKLEELPSSNHLNTKPDESLPPESELERKMWRLLNRLCSSVARTKAKLKKRGFTDPSTSIFSKCGKEDHTFQHRFTCSLLNEPCSIADLC